MTFWAELPSWTRELITMWGMFIAVVFLICGGAWLVERRK